MGLFKNLFGKSDDFFDKEATIKEYFALVPPEKREEANDYDELYRIALKYVEKQSFAENTKDLDDYFHEITDEEAAIAVILGFSAFNCACLVDCKGKSIEKAIDDVLPDKYDVNNPFDTKKGYGHRVFGHDPITFGIKNIPANYGISVDGKAYKIGEYLGVGDKGYVSMMDLIWKFYGDDNNKLKGICNVLGHTIVHFGKDLCTPAGLPMPFLSLFNKYELTGNKKYSYVRYKESLIKKFDDKKINMKASDFASYFIIKVFLEVYFNTHKVETDEVGFKRDMSLIAMGTCICLQMATIILGESKGKSKKGNTASISGGKINALMMSDFTKIAFQDMKSVIDARNKINTKYKTDYMGDYYHE